MLEPYIKRAFFVYTPFLVRHRKYFILGPILLTCLLSIGLFRFSKVRFTDPIRLYTPKDAAVFTERKAIKQAWPVDPEEFTAGTSYEVGRMVMVILTLREQCPNSEGMIVPCNILGEDEEENINGIIEFETALVTEVQVEWEGRLFSYEATNTSESACLNYNGKCHRMANELSPLRLLQHRHNEFVMDKLGTTIAYPQVTIRRGTPRYIASTLGLCEPTNGSTIEVVRAIKHNLFLRNDRKKGENDYNEISRRLEIAMNDYAVYEFAKTKLGRKYVASASYSRAFGAAMQANARALVPNFVVTFAVLILFSFIMMLQFGGPEARGRFGINMVTSKPYLAFCGIATAMMGIISGEGLLMASGMWYADSNSVVPFLVVSMGVDDMFVLVAGWQNTDRRHSVERRMQQSMCHGAIAITITSITSSLSFAIGTLTTLPGVQSFCVYAAVCIFFDYLYQITFFAACMASFGHREADGRNSFKCCGCSSSNVEEEEEGDDGSIESKLPEKSSPTPIIHNIGNEKSHEMEENDAESPVQDSTLASKFIRDWYAPFLLHPLTKVVALLLFAVYLSMSIYGVTAMKQGFRLEKLLLDSDPVAIFSKEDYDFFPGGIQMDVLFNNVPDITKQVNRDAIERAVQDFESSRWAYGNRGTIFWMREYIKYMEETRSHFRDNEQFWIDGVINWQHTDFKIWGRHIKWHPTKREITAFRLKIGIRNGLQPILVWESTRAIRAIADKHPQFNITSYFLGRTVADQLEVVLPNTVQNVCLALVCMAIISVLFIPRPFYTILIVLTIMSIDVGVVGFMSLWGLMLDPICMITIIMSIGFAIDFSAHITYGFVSADASHSHRQRIIDAMQNLAWPVFQGATSTLLGVATLATVQSHMVNVFFKNIVLVIIFGVMHALVFVPVVLDTVMPLVARWQWSKGSKVSSSASTSSSNS